MSLSFAVSHFLNCLLCGAPISSPATSGVEELQSKTAKRRNKRNKNGALNNRTTTNEWALLTQKSLWTQIRHELKSYWDFEPKADSLDSYIDNYGLLKISLLRFDDELIVS